MENKTPGRLFWPVLVIFVVTNTFFLAGKSLLRSWHIEPNVMIISNLILFIATTISFYFYNRSLRNNHVPTFLRMIYSAMFIKMLICLFAAFIYISIAGKSVNKGAIFVSMFLYFLYTFVEIAVVMKISKQTQNA